MAKGILKIPILGLIALLIIVLLLMLFGKLDPLYFWVMAILAGAFAYWVLPRIKK
jgi:hypothetical protein